MFDDILTRVLDAGLVRELNEAWIFEIEEEEDEEEEIFWNPFGLLAMDDIVEYKVERKIRGKKHLLPRDLLIIDCSIIIFYSSSTGERLLRLPSTP